MIKKFLCIIVVVITLSVFAVAQEKDGAEYFDAYTLCYNSTHNGSHEGIQAGWTLDNRGGRVRISISGEYNMLEDISNTEGSALYRDLNRTDSGVVTLETCFKIVSGLDGFILRFTDDEKNTVYSLEVIDGAFHVLSEDGSYRKTAAAEYNKFINVKAVLDFTSGTVLTVIDGISYGRDKMLSDNIMRFSYMTTSEDRVAVKFAGGTKITANYHIHDDFVFNTGSTHVIPYKWQTTDISDAYAADTQGYVKNGAVLTRDLTESGANLKGGNPGGNLVFEGLVYVPDDVNGSFVFYNGNSAVTDISFDKDRITSCNTEVYDGYLHDFWYKVRMEMNLDNKNGIVKINGRKYADITFSEADTISSLKITADGEGIQFDGLKLYNVLSHDDYVPEPVKPSDKENNIVGINVCSLWAYTSNHGWACTTPYEEVRPVLGYYDEGSPESADWEIKMMVEHGIDFQAFCWYADKNDAPLKDPRNMLQLHDGYMNSKYGDMMNYCIMWEAANGAHPASSEAFRNYFVPYWIEYYFKDPRYMVIDNKPVVMCFSFTSFINDMGSTAKARAELDYLREEIKKLGFEDMIFIASHSGNTKQLLDAGVDAVCAYNWGTKGYDLDYSIGRIKEMADEKYNWTIPTLSTGFNSLPWHGKRYPNMSVSDYEDGLNWMKNDYFKLYPAEKSWQNKLYMLSTWNEYGEGTYVMPAEKLNGYGYLEAIRKVMTDSDNVTHKDIIPEAEQLERFNKNYPQHIRLLRRLDKYEPELEKIDFESENVVFAGKDHFKAGKCENVSYENGVKGITTGSLSYVETKDKSKFDFKNASFLRITMSVSEATTVKLYYSFAGTTPYSHNNCLSFDAEAGGLKQYELALEGNMDAVNSIRIIPAEKAGVSFEIKQIEIVKPAQLYIDEFNVTANVYPETIDGTTYFPFDPGVAEGFLMGLHHEWDYENKKLTLYGNGDTFAEYTAGSDIVVSSSGNIKLPYAVYLSDGLPMLHMETLCDIFGYEYSYKGKSFYIKTDEYSLNSIVNSRPDHEWNFLLWSQYGWTGNANTVITEDGMSVIATDRDTRMVHSNINISAERYSGVEVCVEYKKLLKKTDYCTIYFLTSTDKTWNEEKGKHNAVINKTGVEQVYYFDFSEISTWDGIITSLRYDPFNCEGNECVVKYIKFVENPDFNKDAVFAEVSFDAENGKNPFTSENAVVSIVKDPLDETNKVFRVAPKSTSKQYINMHYGITFEPGASYTVTYDVLHGAAGGDKTVSINTTVHTDPRYDDPKQYGKKNPDDHIDFGKVNGNTNSTKWLNVNLTFTVNPDSFIRSKDVMRIYANPPGNTTSMEFFVDNFVLKKNTEIKLSVSEAQMKDGSVTVRGDTGIILPAYKNVYIGIYDKDGRMLGIKTADCSENAVFEVTFENAGEAVCAKAFMWSGLKTLSPFLEEKQAVIEKIA